MSRLVALADALRRPVSAVGRSSAWLSLPLAGVIVFDVVTRRFFVLGSTRLQELEWHLHAALFLLLLAWAYLRDAHVRIDIVRERLSPRARAWIEVVGCLLFLIPYAATVVYFSAEFWYRSFVIDEASAATTGIPHRWVIKAALPVGFALLFLAGLATLLERLAFLLSPADEPGRGRDGEG